MFSHVERPAILVDAQQRIVAINRQGEELLNAGTFVTQVDGSLSCADESSHSALKAAIAAGSVHADQASQTVIHLPKTSTVRRGSARQLGVTVMRLAPFASDAASGTAGATLTLLTFQNVPMSSLDLASNAMRCFGLTSAQARVATELAGGKTIKQIAFYSGVSVNTVRHHVKAIFAKTSTNRQVELVQMLSQLAQTGGADAPFNTEATTSGGALNGTRPSGAGPRPSSTAEMPAH